MAVIECSLSQKQLVMPALVAGIHVFLCDCKDVDARLKATAVRFDFYGQGA